MSPEAISDMARKEKILPAAWATECLRELEERGDIARIRPIISEPTAGRPVVGVPVAGVRPTPVSQWKYVSVERVSLYLEASIQEGTKWVVFEPNGPELWGQVRQDVGEFMQNLFLQGAFQGTTPEQAYFVRCDADNNTQATMAQGIVNIVVGFAPLYPAEFVVIPISQFAGQKPPPP